MAGPGGPDLAIEVGKAGGLASLPCAMLTPEGVRAAVRRVREAISGPLNLNFFCHTAPAPDPDRERAWRARLAPYYAEWGLAPDATVPVANRAPFDDAYCALVEAEGPEVVSFHFGLPEPALVARVRAAGARVLASATTVEEALWLEARGCDAIIAQGAEAGGHRGNFLADDMNRQVGLFALTPQIVDAVRVPVIAAGAIGDSRGIQAALALGAAGVQIGTAYLLTPEALTPPAHRAALIAARDDGTALTNLFTGRPARGLIGRLMREIGPMSADAPVFPLAGVALAPLRAKAEAAGVFDFTNQWSGQASALARPEPAADLTRRWAAEALAGFATRSV
jgi:nitronate monooxygenase